MSEENPPSESHQMLTTIYNKIDRMDRTQHIALYGPEGEPEKGLFSQMQAKGSEIKAVNKRVTTLEEKEGRRSKFMTMIAGTAIGAAVLSFLGL